MKAKKLTHKEILEFSEELRQSCNTLSKDHREYYRKLAMNLINGGKPIDAIRELFYLRIKLKAEDESICQLFNFVISLVKAAYGEKYTGGQSWDGAVELIAMHREFYEKNKDKVNKNDKKPKTRS